jgi:hypothetical protein
LPSDSHSAPFSARARSTMSSRPWAGDRCGASTRP